MPEDILKNLRRQTRSGHERVERHVNVLRSDLSLAEYVHLLRRMLGIYEPLEEAIARTAAQRPAVAELMRERFKAHLLKDDLSRLGMNADAIAALPRCSSLPALVSAEQLLGCCYVVEGSSLGGRLIAQHVQRVLGIGQANGCAFFLGYGPQLATRWQDFTRQLIELADGLDRQLIVAGANQTFDAFGRWLSGGAEDAGSTAR